MSSPPSFPRVVAEISSRSASRSSLIVPSSSFRATFPVKPSATTTSAAKRSRSRASVFPLKFSPLSREERVRFEDEVVALLRLLADREQPHLGVRPLEDLLGEDRAHVRELHEVLGPRVGVRPGVDQHRRPVARREHDRDRRPVDALQPPDLEQPRREHRAGVPGRDDGVGTPLADGAVRHDERALRLRTDGLGGLLVHRDPLGRLDELETAGVEPGRAEEDRLDRVAPRLEGACDDLLRGAVAPHRVDRDAGATAYGAWMWSGSTSRPL